MQDIQIVARGTHGVLDVLGPTIEFLLPPQQTDTEYCVMIGSIPPGVCVPIHTHSDIESFYVLSGNVELLRERGDEFEWLKVKSGDFAQVPGGRKHAFRNHSAAPVVQLITTGSRLGRFFQEVGRPVQAGATPQPPSPADLERFARAAARYGHWLASPAENAAAGIAIPGSSPQARAGLH